MVALASKAHGNTQEPHAHKGFHFWLNKVHTCISHGLALAPVLKFLVQSGARTCKMHFHFALHPTGSVAGPAVCFIFYGRYTKWSIIARCHRWAEIRRRLCVWVSSLHGVPSHDKGHISVSHRPVNHLYANASQVVLVV